MRVRAIVRQLQSTWPGHLAVASLATVEPEIVPGPRLLQRIPLVPAAFNLANWSQDSQKMDE